MKKRSSGDEIPWRTRDVETLRRFLISAQERVKTADSTAASTTLGDRLPGLALSSDDGLSRQFAGISPRVADRDADSQPLDYTHNAPPHNAHRPSQAIDSVNSVETQANICILRGQTGSGKVTAVRRLCQEIGLKIIEYDPFEIDVIYMSHSEAYDAMTATFLRFLDTVRRKPGLRVSHEKMSPSKPPEAFSRRAKRIRLAMDLQPAVVAVTNDNTSSQEPHVILLRDIPRTLTGNNSDCARLIQEVTRSILNGEGCSGGVTPYPLIICVNNTSSDRQLLHNILPYNYKTHPRCLSLNVNQITKAKVKTILHRYLDSLKRGRNPFNDRLVDYISTISCGDLRFGKCNLHFYSGVDHTSVKSPNEDFDVVRNHMFERNSSAIVFNILGKVLVNKRVPAVLCVDSNSMSNVIEAQFSLDRSSIIERFGCCFKVSRPVEILACEKVTNACSITEDYSDVLEILSSLSDDLSEAAIKVEFLPQHEENDLLGSLSGAAVTGNYTNLYQSSFYNSALGDMPIGVRLYGLCEPFDASKPQSLCRWPIITGDTSATPTRLPRSAQLPVVTRPQIYYNPDELVESSNVESCFLIDSLLENYSIYYESIDDCAALTAHLCTADVYITGHRHAGAAGDDTMDSAHITFACLCVRAASCSNLGGIESSTGFRQFTKGAWQSGSRHEMNRMKDLYDGHIRDLNSRNQTPSCCWTGAYLCKSRAFVEIVPFLYMLLTSNPAGESSCYQSPPDRSLSGCNIMTKSMLERIDMLMEVDRHSTLEKVCPTDIPFDSVMDTMTPKFEELVSELGKHYERRSGRRWV
ncbi:uncharacterized protein BXIN_3100 [Babesia sp. Xinjiang]|uniref:uncharacterized protein n=1 Tax=Babesia sp. Xinjiang TaxID=462227 RepID=UPI000A24B09F|nr:uncharacterized protein BXIN_3100 [Babesia sp. Xinjiang]ORM39412.1 hypothetical protein BXIN_3100 [Babesia sp. Xinjiang]